MKELDVGDLVRVMWDFTVPKFEAVGVIQDDNYTGFKTVRILWWAEGSTPLEDVHAAPHELQLLVKRYELLDPDWRKS